MLVAELVPGEPEALGLAALVLLTRSRAGSRQDGEGAMVPLSQQDTARWDYARIKRARGLMDRAAGLGLSGPYQVMAAIQITHARRAFDGVTDWVAVLQLYDVLLMLRPTPMVALSRALALAQVEGVEAGAGCRRGDSRRSPRARPAIPCCAVRFAGAGGKGRGGGGGV